MFDAFWYILITPGIPTLVFVAWLHWYLARRDQRSRRPFEEMQRPAGWSLQNRMSDLMDHFTMYFLGGFTMATVVSVTAVSNKESTPVMLGIGLLICSVLFYRAGGYVLRYSNHRLGLLGEQVVGRTLDQLASDAIQVFHDLEVREPGCKPWNIDHVVVTSAGVFAIETKCRRKPRGIAPGGQQGHKVIFDGQQLRFPAPMAADRHGIDQTQRNADWLSSKLTALNGTPIPVTPVLVLPGWWVEATGKGPVSVISHKALPKFLTGRSPTLAADRQRAIAAQLEERCRIDLSRPA